jgi:hypothetical protein
VPGNADLARLLAAPAATETAPAASIGDETRKAEIRARLEAEARDARLEAEVRREMAAEANDGLDPDAPSNPDPGQVDDPEADRQAAERGEIVPLQEPGVPGSLPPDPASASTDEVIPGVTVAQRDALVAAGFSTPDDIKGATDEQLLAVPGIGPETVKRLREAAKA